MIKKLNSMRMLEAQGVCYEGLSFPDTIHSAVGVAAYYGLPPAQVYKTLVVVLSQGKPALVLIAGDREIQIKQLAQAVGEKPFVDQTHSRISSLKRSSVVVANTCAKVSASSRLGT